MMSDAETKTSRVKSMTARKPAPRTILNRAMLASVMLAASATAVPADAVDVEHLVIASRNDPETVSIVIERLTDGQMWLNNASRAAAQLPPASTAKIPHTLIALENGLADATTVFA